MTKKLKLEPENLQVETFTTQMVEEARGTVKGLALQVTRTGACPENSCYLSCVSCFLSDCPADCG